jgi:hypothetical protein
MDDGDPKPGYTGTPLTIVDLSPGEVDGPGVVEGVELAADPEVNVVQRCRCSTEPTAARRTVVHRGDAA